MYMCLMGIIPINHIIGFDELYPYIGYSKLN